MTTDRISAIDEVLGRVNSTITGLSSIVGYEPETRWQNIEQGTPPDAAKYWLRTTVQTVEEMQAGLSVAVQEIGKRRFTSFGLVFVQIFCPQSDVEANEKGNKIAMLIRNNFRAAIVSGKVTFRNARIQELAPDAGAVRFNVVAEIEYDEIS